MKVLLRGLEDDGKLFTTLQAISREDLAHRLALVRHYVPVAKKEIRPHQAALLHLLAAEVPAGGTILEIGTNRGFSAAVMALAAPEAYVITLESDAAKAQLAAKQLGPLDNIHVINTLSRDYLQERHELGDRTPRYDLIFVDGDHNRIAEDMPWFNRVKVGGLFLCDDYSPLESTRPSPIVYQVLNEFAATLGREPDVLMVDAGLHGMLGFYRQENEVWR